MKENWMKKLIELLNEYDDNNWGVTDYWALYNKMDEWISETEYLQVISKDFWFIKWLVQNNKIDIERLHKIVDYRLEIKENYVNAHDYNSDCLLMLLSISDNPIEFLCSVIK